MKSFTEKESKYRELEHKTVFELLTFINDEDKTVAFAVEKAIPQIEPIVDTIVKKLRNGGRLFLIGAGTSGRLGVVDASECPPTFGVDHNTVIGIIAGGDSAIRKAVEGAEDNFEGGWNDLQKNNVGKKDFVLGITASGSTPYVVGALQHCCQKGIKCGVITCNPQTAAANEADFPIEVIVDAEFLTGSTRMKAGTAQKLVLNMISTATMIKLGKVKDNKMVDMKISNNKLIDRGTRIIMKAKNLSYNEAKKLLLEKGSVRKAL